MFKMTATEIVNTLQQRATKGEAFADVLLADATRASADADFSGLAFIVNMTLGQRGDSKVSMGLLMDVADILSPRSL
jgi:hypothetical protein